MNRKIDCLSMLVSILCVAAQSPLFAEPVQVAEEKCEAAIEQKLNVSKKPEKVNFESESRRSIPHGPLTHYAGKGTYLTPDGASATFEWFCDIQGSAAKPSNLYYTVLKVDGPANKVEEPKKEEVPKSETKAEKPWVRECQSAVESVIRKKKTSLSDLQFRSARVSRASNAEDLVEGEGSFAEKLGEEIKFSYRCAYNVEKGKITAKSVQMQ